MAKVIPINQRMLAKHRMKKYLKNGRETSERRAENIRTETANIFRESILEALIRDESLTPENIEDVVNSVRPLRNKHDLFERTYGISKAYEALKGATDEFMPEGFLLPITDPVDRAEDWDLITIKRQAADIEARIFAAGMQSELEYDIDDIGAVLDDAAGIYWTRVMQDKQKH